MKKSITIIDAENRVYLDSLDLKNFVVTDATKIPFRVVK